MFNVETLVGISGHFNDLYQERLALFGPGTYDFARNEYRKLSEQAMTAAEFMIDRDIETAANVGEFETTRVLPGQKVIIKAGAMVVHRGKRTTNKRRRTITIHHVISPYIGNSSFHHHTDGDIVRNRKICWAGAGGYWSDVDINDVELIPA